MKPTYTRQFFKIINKILNFKFKKKNFGEKNLKKNKKFGFFSVIGGWGIPLGIGRVGRRYVGERL